MNKKSIITIGLFANIAEWYDFSVYAFLAVSIGTIFFHSKQPSVALIMAFLVFSISYIVRPIGSFCWGYMGDTRGRKIALKWCLFSMAIPGTIIGMLPVGDKFGILPSLALIFLRLVQGFAAGGELPISACYVYEMAPRDKKNFFCSIVAVSPIIGILIGSAIVSIVYAFFTSEQILAYAWRIPFLLSFFVFLVILYVRKDILETTDFGNSIDCVNKKIKFGNFFKSIAGENVKKLSHIMLLYVFVQSSFYLLFVWMPSYLNVFLQVTKEKSYLSNTIGISCLVLFTLIIGFFGEGLKHKKLVLCSLLSMLFLAAPMFLLIQTGKFQIIIIVQIIFALSLACVDAVIMNILNKSFDVSVRCSSVGIVFVLPSAVLGGVLPTLCSYLIYKTHLSIMPAIFLTLICLIVAPVIWKSEII